MSTWRVLWLGALLAAAPAARAAAPARAAPPAADLGQKRSVAPDAALGGSLQAAKKPAGEGGPALDFETFRRTVEYDISGKRREEIANLQKLIQLGGGSAEETPQWYYRLADLLWQESQYFFFEANRRDDRLIALGTRGDPKEIDRLMAEKAQLEAQQKDRQNQAIALYKAIIKRYPKYPRLDEVLFFLGQNLAKRDRNDPEAMQAFRLLIKGYPASPYVPDAYMAFGEYYFELANKHERTDNLGRALEAYKKAAEHQESSIYGYALYKQGWVHYNLGNWSEALELFRAVIFLGENPASTVPAEKKLALVKEARKDYVRTYSHVGGAERAYDEFKRVGGEAGWWEMLKTLGGLYFDEGKDRDAVLVYARLIREKPLSVEAPLFQSRIVTCAGRMGRKDAAVAQAHVFVKMLGQIEASPEGKDPKNAKAISDARADAERTLRILAVQYHNEWKKTRDDPVAGYAAAVYEDYLEVFPNEQPAYELRFFHAELLYALGQYAAAGAEYDRVAAVDAPAAAAPAARPGEPPRKPGKFFKDALENAVFAYDLVAKKLDETQKLPVTEPQKRIPMAPERQKLAEACERYLKWQPAGDKWVEIAYKAANLYYRHNDFARASDLFTRIALDHPEHELAGYSTNLVLDAYNLLGDWRNVNGWAKRFHANRALLAAHPGLEGDLARIIEQSAFKVIEERERAKDWDAATDEYLAFARDWPQSRLAATALYNASVDQVRAGRLDRAMEIRDQFQQRHPHDPLAAQCLYDNAEAYETIGDFGEAAERYERYFAEWRRAQAPAAAKKAKARGKAAAAAPAEPAAGPAFDEKKARDAIINAALFRNGLREWARTEADSQAYLDAWPDGPDAPRLFLALADVYEKRGQVGKALKQLEDYQREYAKDPDEWLVIQHRIAQRYEKSGNGPMARKAWADAVAYWRRGPARVKERGMAPVAQGLFLAVEPEFEAFEKITLDVRPQDLKWQLQRKAAKWAHVEGEYRKIATYKQAEPTVCALYRIGLGYRRFADALLNAPIPREIRGNKAYVEEYRSQVSQLADPLEAKSVEGFELAVKAARENGVANACAHDAAARMAKAKPELYGPSPEVIPPIAAPALAARPAGYGLLAEVQPAAAPRKAAAADRADPAGLPPLRVKPAAVPGGAAAPARRAGAAPGRETGDMNDPQRRTPDAQEPLPARKGGSDDEDLLP